MRSLLSNSSFFMQVLLKKWLWRAGVCQLCCQLHITPILGGKPGTHTSWDPSPSRFQFELCQWESLQESWSTDEEKPAFSSSSQANTDRCLEQILPGAYYVSSGKSLGNCQQLKIISSSFSVFPALLEFLKPAAFSSWPLLPQPFQQLYQPLIPYITFFFAWSRVIENKWQSHSSFSYVTSLCL